MRAMPWTSLTIPGNGTQSNVLKMQRSRAPTRTLLEMWIGAPDEFDGTVNIMVSLDDGGSYQKLGSGGAVIELEAGVVTPLTSLSCTHLFLEASETQSEVREFTTHVKADR